LRDYGVEGQLGLEPTPEAYVAAMVEVFRDVRRVLHDSGTVWLNVGDSYARNGGTGGCGPNASVGNTTSGEQQRNCKTPDGLKEKDLCMIPWRLAIALQADGWWLRSVICWAKKSCMPESVTDRPTNSWEPIFLLAKSSKYFYDAEAVKETAQDWSVGGPGIGIKETHHYAPTNGGNAGLKGIAAKYKSGDMPNTRNQRNVWHLGPEPYADAHFATFPTEIPRRAIKAGSREGDTILDPFTGSGTTGEVAIMEGRNFIGCELNPVYRELARKRIHAAAPLFAQEVA
jgi:DNA modification methylase